MKRAEFEVIVRGNRLGRTLSPVLQSLTVSDKVGTHTDSARIEIDDTDGRVSFPPIGAPIEVLLGWRGDGIRSVFVGTVDEVSSRGERGGGRSISITAKGLDTTKAGKEPQQRHFDDMTVEEILTEAGKAAGISRVSVDPSLASIVRKYMDMRDESFAHFGERIAREIGANFAIRGTEAILTPRAAPYTSFVRAAWGENLHSWDIRPEMGRPAFSAARARFYDMAAAAWRDAGEATGLSSVASEFWHRWPKADEQEAKGQAASDKATTERDATEGGVVIEGNTAAIPDGLCVISGARPGVDGAYRIEAVTHKIGRGGGFTTALSLKRNAQIEAGAATEAEGPDDDSA